MSLGLLGFVSVKNFRKFLASIILNISFYFSSSSGISIICMFHHLHCSGIPRYSILSLPFFFFFFFLSLYFTLGIFYCYIFKFTVSSPEYSQSTSEPIKGILYFCYIVFYFFYDTLFKFASLHLHYPYILAYYRLFTLEPLAYCNYFKFLFH